MQRVFPTLILSALAALVSATTTAAQDKTAASRAAPTVETMRVPEGGIQPQAVVGAGGTIHLIYYRGDPAAGDLFHVTREPADAAWSKPRRVNSQAGSAVAIGTDRGGQIAVGRNGMVHVAWNGSRTATPKSAEESSPMLYARLVPGQPAFSAQRNVMKASGTLDGGGSVAADAQGNVFVVWHGVPVTAAVKNEAARRVFVATSHDDGATFAADVARSDGANGACGCCGLKAAVLPDGALLVLYRAARQTIHRGVQMMRSTDGGKTFTDTMLDDWEINACPMTTAAIIPLAAGTALAWETQDDVRWATLPARATTVGTAHAVPGKTDRRRYPTLAANASGQVLMAWTEGMGWNAGGRMRWSAFDAGGGALAGASGGADGVPAWSLVAAIARPGGGFLIIY